MLVIVHHPQHPSDCMQGEAYSDTALSCMVPCASISQLQEEKVLTELGLL